MSSSRRRKAKPEADSRPAHGHADPTHEVSPDLLFDLTGQSTVFWLGRIEALIVESTVPIPTDQTPAGLSPGHGETDAGRVFGQLFAEVAQRLPSDQPIDSNMWLAKVLGAILVVWFSRLAHAKAHDPVRPLALRQIAVRRRQAYLTGLFDALTSSEHDAEVWRTQRWQSPFTGQSTGGRFR